MTRRLLNLLTALSLLLCVAVVALWVRSLWRSDEVIHTRDTYSVDEELGVSGTSVTECGASYGAGRVRVWWMAYRWDRGFAQHWGESNGWNWKTRKVEAARARRWDGGASFLERLGFTCWMNRHTGLNPGKSAGLTLPLWFPGFVLAVLPAARAYRRLRRPARPGACTKCGYDLRATPDRCPECGTPAAGGVEA